MKKFMSATYFVASILLFSFEPAPATSATFLAAYLGFALLNLLVSALIVKNQFKQALK